MSKYLMFTLEELQEASEGYGGYCISCGAYHSSVEPDARRYICTDCEEPTVYGADEILLMNLVK